MREENSYDRYNNRYDKRDDRGNRYYYYEDDAEEDAPRAAGFGANLVKALREVLETLIPAVVIALLINLFLAQSTLVYGQSMEPNLYTNQRIVVEKLTYHFHGPRRGDVVVLKPPGNENGVPLIKRVIGLPGDRIEVKDNRVYINGVALDEPYLSEPTYGDYGPVDVPPLHIFVMGDNRNYSNDSRSFGMVPLENIIGHAWLSYWPTEQMGMVE